MGNIMLHVAILPNIVTFCNVATGTIAIIFAVDNLHSLASLLIIAGALCDRFDGILARKYEVSNEFGKQLDSLADIITFGVAPVINVYMLNFAKLQVVGIILTVTFVICGVYRLARFNTLDKNNFFVGVPITAAGSLLAILVLYQAKFPVHPFITAIGILFLSYSMVCRRQFKKI